ncbi:MAG: hypothetical protein QXU79_04380 [Candidatus Micrarchaeaceae archaeon]
MTRIKCHPTSWTVACEAAIFAKKVFGSGEPNTRIVRSVQGRRGRKYINRAVAPRLAQPLDPIPIAGKRRKQNSRAHSGLASVARPKREDAQMRVL